MRVSNFLRTVEDKTADTFLDFMHAESFAIVLASAATLRMGASRFVERRNSSATIPARMSATAKLVSTTSFSLMSGWIPSLIFSSSL